MPAAFQMATFAAIAVRGLPENKSIADSLKAARAYCDALKDRIRDGNGLLMLGKCGLMKTTLACAVLLEAYRRGYKCHFLAAPTFIGNLIAQRTLDKERAARKDFLVREADLLVIDDLGGESSGKPWAAAEMDRYITQRCNDIKATIITTNLTDKELARTYQLRVYDRIRNSSARLAFDGASLRTWRESA